MKKKNLNLKLQFNKETIAKLNNDQLNEVKGGTATQVQTCGWKSECNCSAHGATCVPSLCTGGQQCCA